MKTLDLVPFKNITNCCGRTLKCERELEVLMPESKLAATDILGPYYLPDGRIEFKRVKEHVLFADDITLGDINQGLIGDCWFLSAIDFSINHPLYKDTLHQSVTDGGNNKVKVRLYDTDSGRWQETLVDKSILVHETDVFPITMSVKSSDPRELWPAMLEKGLAKMCGGYPSIEGGLMSEGMSFLHGGRGYFASSKDIVPLLLSCELTMDDLFNDLRVLYDTGYGIFTAWERDMFSDTKEKGLVDGHAYSILDFKCVEGEWIVKLKNPWGKFEWNGKYSDKDASEKAKKVHEAMHEGNSDNGVFLMSAFDLFGRCEGLDIFEPLDGTWFRR